jgi:hypothetical protein
MVVILAPCAVITEAITWITPVPRESKWIVHEARKAMAIWRPETGQMSSGVLR